MKINETMVQAMAKAVQNASKGAKYATVLKKAERQLAAVKRHEQEREEIGEYLRSLGYTSHGRLVK